MAVACENLVRVLRAGESSVRWSLVSDAVLSATIDWSNASRGPSLPTQSAASSNDDRLFCPPQLWTQPFLALSWSPLGSVADDGCLLCAAVAHVCSVYARPRDPLRLHLRPVAHLAPILHAALGHASPPTEAQCADATIISSSWSPVLPCPAGGECVFLALAGPAVLAVVAHVPGHPSEGEEGEEGEEALATHEWKLAARLRHPGGGGGGGASCVNFAAGGGARGPAGSRLQLFSGGADGSIVVWFLEAQASGEQGVELRCAASRLVGPCGIATRRISSMSSAALAEPRPPSGVGAAAPEASGRVALVAASGPFVLVLGVDLGAVRDDEAGGGAAGERIGSLAQQAAHAHEVTCVRCTRRRWFSAAYDGSVMHGPLGGADGDTGDDEAEAGVCHLQYPLLSRISSGGQAKQRAPITLPDGHTAYFLKAPTGSAGADAHIDARAAAARAERAEGGAAEGEADESQSQVLEASQPSHRLVFGLAASPCGGGVLVALRGRSEVASTRQYSRLDTCRLLICSPPPGGAPLGLGGAEGAADGAGEGGLGSYRPRGGSVWALGVCARSVPAGRRARALAELEELAEGEGGGEGGGGGDAAGRLRSLQLVSAVAYECIARLNEAGDEAGGEAASGGADASGGAPAPMEVDSGGDAAARADGGAGSAARLVAERCGRRLLRAQALSLVGRRAASGEPASAPAAEPAEAAGALAAADWLLADAAAGVSGAAEDGALPPLALTPSLASDLRSEYRAAGCAEGEAAVAALLAGKAAKPPRRESCELCGRRVEVSTRATHACEGGHELQRCWACFKVLPMEAWTCLTCGAGSCTEHGAGGCPAAGVLCELSPRGICGLCGSPCEAPRMALLG